MAWVDNIEDIFSYDPETGVVAWKISPRAPIVPGQPFTGVRTDGYLRAKYKGQEYAAHRVAFRLMTGRMPVGFIDHRNGNTFDNRWSNLREATPQQNSSNRRGTRDGLKGVTFHRVTGKFQAQCKAHGQNYYLGLFETEDEAHRAYIAKAKEVFGEFARAA